MFTSNSRVTVFCAKLRYNDSSNNSNSTRLITIFQDNPDKSVPEYLHCGFYWSKDAGGGGDNWSHMTSKAPIKPSPPNCEHPTSYSLDALSVLYCDSSQIKEMQIKNKW